MGYQIKSPLPGTILDVKVTEGQGIKAGDPVIILEAMKMENELPAEFDGTVDKVCVSKGQAVQTGELLVEVK